MTRYDIRNRFTFPSRWSRRAFVAGALCSVSVAAQADFADPAFERFRSQVTGNQVAFSYGGSGSPLAGGTGQATGIGVSSGVDLQRGHRVNTVHGPINGTLKQKVSSNAMGKAFGRAAALIGGPVGLAFLALPAIVEWMSDAGVSHDGTGFTALSELPVGYDGYEYMEETRSSTSYQKTKQQACVEHAVYRTNTNMFQEYRCANADAGYPYFTHQQRDKGSSSAWGITTTLRYTRRVDPSPPVQVQEPLDAAQLEARMSSVMNPTPEALAELYKLGESQSLVHPIPDMVDVLRGEWEAKSKDSVKQKNTSTPTQDKNEVETCAVYTQWVGQTLSLVEQCETTTTTQPKNPVTGLPEGPPTVETTTTTDTGEKSQVKPGEEAGKDEGLCALFPGIAACASLDTPTEEVPASERTITYSAENLGLGSGACPAPFGFGGTLGTHSIDLAPYCEKVEDIIRPLVILFSLLAAFFIVAPTWSST